jgi:hypothetical protein
VWNVIDLVDDDAVDENDDDNSDEDRDVDRETLEKAHAELTSNVVATAT